jgi:hypothetical protein
MISHFRRVKLDIRLNQIPEPEFFFIPEIEVVSNAAKLSGYMSKHERLRLTVKITIRIFIPDVFPMNDLQTSERILCRISVGRFNINALGLIFAGGKDDASVAGDVVRPTNPSAFIANIEFKGY